MEEMVIMGFEVEGNSEFVDLEILGVVLVSWHWDGTFCR